MSLYSPHIDLLTATWKRDFFEAALGKQVSDAQRRHVPLSLIYVDVDDLQEHNDVHGRAALDAALSWLASKISEVIDGQGPIGRVGGDEYAVYISGCTLERALRLAERLRKLVPQTLHASAFGDYRLTLSVGVATMRRGEPFGNLIQAAEEACRKAKQAGRDAVASR